jgi:hypothetical protein
MRGKMKTEIEELYCYTVSDLERRIKASDPFEVLGASAVLRKLFLDEITLVDQVNKTYRIKLQFDIGVPRPDPEWFPKPVWRSLQDGLDASSGAPGTIRQSVNRHQFFKTPVIYSGNIVYTIKDVILFEAHVMGGVHAGSAATEAEKALKELNDFFLVGGYRHSLRQLKAIGRVAVKALQPLSARMGCGRVTS